MLRNRKQAKFTDLSTARFGDTTGSLGGEIILKKWFPMGPIILPKLQLIIKTPHREVACLEFRALVWTEIDPEQVSKRFSTQGHIN